MILKVAYSTLFDCRLACSTLFDSSAIARFFLYLNVCAKTFFDCYQSLKIQPGWTCRTFSDKFPKEQVREASLNWNKELPFWRQATEQSFVVLEEKKDYKMVG